MRLPEGLAAALTLLLTGAAAAAEATPQQQLQSVETAITQERARRADAARASAALNAEIARLQAQSVTVAAAAAADEQALSATEARLTALASDEAAKRAALAAARGRRDALLDALVHLAATPREAWVLGDRTPVEARRSALLLAAAEPALKSQAAGIEAALADIAATEAAEAEARAAQQSKRLALAAEQAQLATIIARKRALASAALGAAEETGRRLQVLAAEAGSLHELVERLESDRRKAAAPQPGGAIALAAPRPPAPGGKPFAQARGNLVAPATGAIVARFGAPDENGTPRRGLTIETRPGTTVVAPYDGEIAFAGPFRGYGQILIIAHGDGYHSLLAGLDRINGSPGQRLVAGEPVGSMSSTRDKPQLYLELRHNNQPIDPLPWLTTRLEKVNG